MNRQARSLTAWTLAAAVVCGLAGCGGGDDEGAKKDDGKPYPPRSARHIRGDTTNAALIRSQIGQQGGGSAEPVAVAAAEGWANLKGVFRLEGSPPAQSTVSVTKDETVCAPGGKQVLDGTMVVGPNQGIANMLVFVTSKVADDWEHESYAAERTKEITGEDAFDQKNCIFYPRVFAMRTSQKLEILNSDPVGHNAQISQFGYNVTIGANDSTMFAPPNKPERKPFAVTCSIHPWMKAWMITRDNPYFAVSSPDGSFEIPNVPAGVELEFQVWHELGKFREGKVNGQVESWSGSKFKRTFTDSQTEELEIVLDASQFE